MDKEMVEALAKDYTTAPISAQDRVMLDYVVKLTKDATKVWKDDINQGAQVLAVWAYNTAQLPAMLPRRPVPPALPETSANAAPAAAAAPADPVAEMDTKILPQVKADEDILKSNLEYLADRIGPRLTGSAQLERASHWTEERFKEAGYANAHLESWQIANNWVRGPSTARERFCRWW